MTKKEDSSALRAPEPSLVPKPKEAPERRSPQAWADAKGTKAWALAGARQHFRWPVGAEVSEADFDDAIKTVSNLQFSSPGVIVRKPAKKARGKRWLSRA